MSEADRPAETRRRCRDIMTKGVATAAPDSTLRDVAELMRSADIGSVPVVDGERLIGIVTDRDIVVRVVAEGGDASMPVSQAMTTELFTVASDGFAFEAIRLMGEKQIRRIPVVDGEGSLVGIIAMADVALEMEDEKEIAETLEDISSGSGFWNKK